ncbi:MAG: hypothetical protein K0B81_07045 [Candidatus Cloacimonetes bacterium]|nr:hypothetical protein [Candidatus Cloacimonadota bacterium]
MGQQQILLLVLVIILVAIAIVIGITTFRVQTVQSNIDAMITDLNNLGIMAYQYRMRQTAELGSAASYDGFDEYFIDLPDGLTDNINGTYTIHTLLPDLVVIQGVSKMHQENNEPIIRWLSVDNDGKFDLFITEPPTQ